MYIQLAIPPNPSWLMAEMSILLQLCKLCWNMIKTRWKSGLTVTQAQGWEILPPNETKYLN